MTRLNLDPSVLKFESIQSAEKGAVYVVQWNGSLELAVGFKLQNSDDHTGLLILTGESAGASEFFIKVDYESPHVSASKLADDWTTTRLILEPAEPGKDMKIGSAGILKNRNRVDIFVREGNDRLVPLFVNLTELVCHRSNDPFEIRLKLVGIEHPALVPRQL